VIVAVQEHICWTCLLEDDAHGLSLRHLQPVQQRYLVDGWEVACAFYAPLDHTSSLHPNETNYLPRQSRSRSQTGAGKITVVTMLLRETKRLETESASKATCTAPRIAHRGVWLSFIKKLRWSAWRLQCFSQDIDCCAAQRIASTIECARCAHETSASAACSSRDP
jgi:hypothetical protein